MYSAVIVEQCRIDVLVASIGISFAGTYIAISLAEVFRVNSIIRCSHLLQAWYLCLVALTIGCSATWCMHLVGMSALVLRTSDGEWIKQKYDLGLIILSLICGLVFVFIGAYIATRDRLYTKERHQLFSEVTKSSRHLSVGKVRSRWIIWREVMFHGTGYITLGGVITGGGLCLTHALGMFAMVSPVVIQWDYWTAATAILVACALCTAGFWILFRVLALYPNWESIRIASAVAITGAVCGIHFIGMKGVSYAHFLEANITRTSKATIFLDDTLMLVITTGFVVNMLMVMIIISDSRKHFYSMRAELRNTKNYMKDLKRMGSASLISSNPGNEYNQKTRAFIAPTKLQIPLVVQTNESTQSKRYKKYMSWPGAKVSPHQYQNNFVF